MSTTREEIIQKIKKLQEMAKSAAEVSTEAEAHAFSAAMQRLMAKHKITMTEVQYQALDDEDPMGRIIVGENYGRPRKKARIDWQESLASAICSAHFCRIVVIQGSSLLYFVGRSSDTEAAAQTFGYMASVAEKIADKEYSIAYRQAWNQKSRTDKQEELANLRGFRRSFLAGFVFRLRVRYEEELETIKSELNKDNNPEGLVRLDRSIEAVRNWMTQNMNTRRAKTTRREVSNLEGFQRGIDSANSIKIGDQSSKISDGRNQKRLL